MMRIGLFLGTQRGCETLKELINKGYFIKSALVLEQQKHELNNFTNQIVEICKQNRISHKTTKKIKSSGYKKYLKKTKPDIVFVINWRYLIPKECFNIPKYGIFVLHDSLLPKYRGFSPTNWVIINGEKETGLSLQYISGNTDAGDIIDQIKIKIGNNETASSLNDKFLKIYPKIITNNIDLIYKGKNKRKKQKEKYATYGAKRTPEDGKIDFNKPTKEILRLIRGLSFPYPGAFCFYEKEKIIIWEAEQVINPPVFSGRIIGKIIESTDNFCDVLTMDGVLRINKVARYDSPAKFLPPNTIFKFFGKSLS